MLAEFLTVIPQTPSLVLITYRPEYRGALSQVQGAQTIALAPLSDPETGALVTGLLGSDPSVARLATVIVERSAGNPFFAEEIVRDLAERGVLHGPPGNYVSTVRPLAPRYGPKTPMPTPTTCCSSRTCWVLPTPPSSCRRLIRMRGGGD